MSESSSLPAIRRSVEGESQFDWVFARAICARAEAGESLRSICRDPAMPSVQTLYVWRANEPLFAGALEAARTRARAAAAERREGMRALRRRSVTVKREGLAPNPGRPSSYDEARGLRICARIAEGESLEAVCRDPAMPAVATVYNWLARHPQFARGYGLARAMQLDAICGEMLELADGATRQTVGVARLRIAVLKDRARRLGLKSDYGERKRTVTFVVTTVRWGDL